MSKSRILHLLISFCMQRHAIHATDRQRDRQTYKRTNRQTNRQTCGHRPCVDLPTPFGTVALGWRYWNQQMAAACTGRRRRFCLPWRVYICYGNRWYAVYGVVDSCDSWVGRDIDILSVISSMFCQWCLDYNEQPFSARFMPCCRVLLSLYRYVIVSFEALWRFADVAAAGHDGSARRRPRRRRQHGGVTPAPFSWRIVQLSTMCPKKTSPFYYRPSDRVKIDRHDIFN